MFVMKIVLLLALLTASGCLGRRVVGRTGENITFTCKYNRKSYGALSVCWNLGDIPSRGTCDNQLISTDGNKVKEQSGVSSRYQLMGRLDQGDVSLTILNLRENDTGRYGCRVDIPGWFNDEKHHFDLTVKAPQVIMTTSLAAETSTESTPANQIADLLVQPNISVSSSRHEVQQQTVRVLLGSNFSIICSTRPQYPGGSFQLVFNSSSRTLNYILPAVTHSAVFLFPAAESLHRGTYTCIYHLNVFSQNFSSTSRSIYLIPSALLRDLILRTVVVLLGMVLLITVLYFYHEPLSAENRSRNKRKNVLADLQ